MASTQDGSRAAENETKEPIRCCPICGKPADFAARPFCSKRCADVDLHRWLGGAYAIPAGPDVETGGNGAVRHPTTEEPEAENR